MKSKYEKIINYFMCPRTNTMKKLPEIQRSGKKYCPGAHLRATFTSYCPWAHENIYNAILGQQQWIWWKVQEFAACVAKFSKRDGAAEKFRRTPPQKQLQKSPATVKTKDEFELTFCKATPYACFR